MTKFESYRGQKQWAVEHPEHGKVYVMAPDEAAAIFAAAKVWKCKWTDCAFHMQAVATRM